MHASKNRQVAKTNLVRLCEFASANCLISTSDLGFRSILFLDCIILVHEIVVTGTFLNP